MAIGKMVEDMVKVYLPIQMVINTPAGGSLEIRREPELMYSSPQEWNYSVNGNKERSRAVDGPIPMECTMREHSKITSQVAKADGCLKMETN